MNKELTDLKLIVNQLQKMMVEQEKKHLSEIKLLKEQVAYLTDKLYGSKSEKKKSQDSDKQLYLFEDTDSEISEEDDTDSLDDPPSKVRRGSKKPGRKPLPEGLKRIEVIHDLGEEEKRCNCGCLKSCCGREVSEQLDYIPAKLQVIRNIRLKYACKSCEGVDDDRATVMIAPLPAQLLPKSNATSGLLAHIITGKFVDSLPFYRQEKQFSRLGIDLSRTTMCNWSAKVAEKLEPLMGLIRKHVLDGNFINADETTFQVLKEQGRAPNTKSYMWVYRGGPPEKPALIFQYEPTRAAKAAKDFLHGFEGHVQTDGYCGYDFIDGDPKLLHVGCFAHARRKFTDAAKAHKKISSSKKKHASDVALTFISDLYAVEKKATLGKMTVEERAALRQQLTVPVLEKFKNWLDEHAITVNPKSLLGKAISYTIGQWTRLIQYVEYGYITPDNNLAENAIRPFVLGRKNWLFSDTPKGANASATLYSIIETAKSNGQEPYHYLKTVFDRLPAIENQEELKSLLPWNVAKI